MRSSDSRLFSRSSENDVQPVNQRAAVPEINVDNFNVAEMAKALRDYGTYKLVGPSIDKLQVLANEALNVAQSALSLPIEILMQAESRAFNGFQNLRANTERAAKEGGTAPIRNQLALHINPNDPNQKLPPGVSGEIFKEYHKAAREILCKHYNDIAEAFMVSKDEAAKIYAETSETVRSELQSAADDKKTVLMMRRYLTPQDDASLVQNNKVTGLPSHSDHGRLTLVYSNAAGLEVGTGEKAISWLGTEANSFYVNLGDWTLFQILRSAALKGAILDSDRFVAGLHRVPYLPHERISLSLSLNPPGNELILTPKVQLGEDGKPALVAFDSFLQSAKSKYRDTSRDESASNMAKQMDAYIPVNPIPAPVTMPILYVCEKNISGQESWKFVHAKDKSLCDPDVTDIPAQAREKCSFGFTDLSDISLTKMPVTTNGAETFEVKLKYANDVYVVDEAVAANNQNDREHIARTLIPLKDYKGDYLKPVYLIQRPLLHDEAKAYVAQERLMTRPK